MKVGETGIALHNRGAGFTEEEGHPNRIAAGRRPFHTIIPGLLLRDGGLLGTFGVMGAAMQAQAHFQVVRRVVDDGLDPRPRSTRRAFAPTAVGAWRSSPGWPARSRACARTATTCASRTRRTASAWAR